MRIFKQYLVPTKRQETKINLYPGSPHPRIFIYPQSPEMIQFQLALQNAMKSGMDFCTLGRVVSLKDDRIKN